MAQEVWNQQGSRLCNRTESVCSILSIYDALPIYTVRRAKSFVAGTAQPLLTLPYTRDELGDALGTTSCAIAAITDVQLALAFVKTLGEPEKYADLLQELDERVKRVEKRRAEEKAHRRNVRHGKS